MAIIGGIPHFQTYPNASKQLAQTIPKQSTMAPWFIPTASMFGRLLSVLAANYRPGPPCAEIVTGHSLSSCNASVWKTWCDSLGTSQSSQSSQSSHISLSFHVSMLVQTCSNSSCCLQWRHVIKPPTIGHQGREPPHKSRL